MINNSEDTGFKKSGKVRRIVVDRSLCIGARSCVLAAPVVFQMDEENLAYIVDPESESDENIILATQSCPVLAIKLFDENNVEINVNE